MLRHHPHAASVHLEEVEQERVSHTGAVSSTRLLNLVATRPAAANAGPALRVGEELVLGGQRWNGELLLEAGYLWDEVRAASVPLRMSNAPTRGHADHRRQLLEQAALNETQDFLLLHGELPHEMMQWGRIMLGTDEDLGRARSAAALRSPLSRDTEVEVVSNLLQSIDQVHSKFDHDLEEDDAMLEAARRRSAPPSAHHARQLLAVQSRRLSKLVLQDGARRIGRAAEAAEHAALRQKASTSTSHYSTRSEREREDAKQRKKQARRDRVRQQRKLHRRAADEPAEDPT